MLLCMQRVLASKDAVLRWSPPKYAAWRSAAAAEKIKTLIGVSVEKVDAGSKLVAQAGSTMDGVMNSVKGATDIMAEIINQAKQLRWTVHQAPLALIRLIGWQTHSHEVVRRFPLFCAQLPYPNGMDAPPVTASMCQSGSVKPPLNREERHHAD
jgi:hypothetical protein